MDGVRMPPIALPRSSRSIRALVSPGGIAASVGTCDSLIRGEGGGGAPPATQVRRCSQALSATGHAGNGLVMHAGLPGGAALAIRSEEHTSELQSHSFISYAVFCLK